MENTELSDVQVLPCLPDWFRAGHGDPMPPDLVGATIIAIGAISAEGVVEDGGLGIDYLAPGDPKVRRVVFGFNDVGMWVEYQSEKR